MDCYKCKYRGTVPGSVHSSCSVIRDTNKEKSFELEMLLASGQYRLTLNDTNDDVVKLNEHGVKNGWASWPIDFDPVWVESCLFYTENENT